jgi:MYXO-CTERM domain-containing protein
VQATPRAALVLLSLCALFAARKRPRQGPSKREQTLGG